MEFRYDAAVDALTINLNDKKSAKTLEINKDVFVDFDENGNITSIELLYVSRYADNVQQITYQYSPKQDRPAKPEVPTEQNESLAVEPVTSETSA